MCEIGVRVRVNVCVYVCVMHRHTHAHTHTHVEWLASVCEWLAGEFELCERLTGVSERM